MIAFLMKGILRDRSRSLFPILTVFIGTALTVLMYGYISGVLPDMISLSANLDAGHVKVMTRSYAENRQQMPLDLALEGVSELVSDLEAEFPDMVWESRTRFGGLLDIPDANGETRAQTTISGLAADLISENTSEITRLNLESSLVEGRLPEEPFEILISKTMAGGLNISIDDEVTLMTSTVNGSMSFHNFTVSGMLVFGISALDKGGAIIADISGTRIALDMEDGSTELLGFFKNDVYDSERARNIADRINQHYSNPGDSYSPIAMRFEDSSEMGVMMELMGSFMAIISIVFILVMFIVLWNSGLMNGLRRYGEMGLRLAIGEQKGHIYRTLLLESALIGIVGTILGTSLGLLGVWLLQEYGIDISDMTKNSSGGMYSPNIIRGRISAGCFYIGFIPGLIAPLLGSLISGRGIYKRQTAALFKELEI